MSRIHHPPHPGETLREDILPALGLDVTQAAAQLGVIRAALSRVLNGRAAIPAELIESELFSHEKGAFTGALAKKMGRVEVADKHDLPRRDRRDPTGLANKIIARLAGSGAGFL